MVKLEIKLGGPQRVLKGPQRKLGGLGGTSEGVKRLSDGVERAMAWNEKERPRRDLKGLKGPRRASRDRSNGPSRVPGGSQRWFGGPRTHPEAPHRELVGPQE